MGRGDLEKTDYEHEMLDTKFGQRSEMNLVLGIQLTDKLLSNLNVYDNVSTSLILWFVRCLTLQE